MAVPELPMAAPGMLLADEPADRRPLVVFDQLSQGNQPQRLTFGLPDKAADAITSR